MELTRRGFIGTAAAALGSAAWGADCAPLLKLGVISDVHIGGRREAPVRLKFTLEWLDAHGVEAVLCAGDVAHSGLVSQLEEFAAIWNGVFPNGRSRRDGREVAFMISTGNHEAAASWVKGKPEWRAKNVLSEGDNFERTWNRLFHLKFAPVWRREVKGITFIGSQWPTLHPDLEGFMRAHGSEIDPSKPFFFCQHLHPLNTCHQGYASSYDKGETVRALSPFPNAVAISGHSHCSIADERAVWQGAFTSIGAGCLHEGGLEFSYDNGTAFWYSNYKTNLMRPLNDVVQAWGGEERGGCFEFIDVFTDHLVVHRRSSVVDQPIGPDWLVPIPSKKDGPLDFARRAAARPAPQFAADAVVRVELCPKGHPLETPARTGEPCLHFVIPGVASGARVFDFLVEARVDGRKVKSGKFLASGFSQPFVDAVQPTDGLFALKDLPKGASVVLKVVPRECFGKEGRAIFSAALALPA